MSRRANKSQPPTALETAAQKLREHPAFRRLMLDPIAAGPDTFELTPSDLAVVGGTGALYVNTKRRLDADEWQWVLAHALLHLGLGHVRCSSERQLLPPDPVEVAAACVEVNRFLQGLDIGRPPKALPNMPRDERAVLTRRWHRDGLPDELRDIGTASDGPDVIHVPCRHLLGNHSDWEAAFAEGLAAAVTDAVDVASGGPGGERQVWDRALSWFVSSYPLLGGIASGMRIVADPAVARNSEISVAAIDPGLGEIYVNPHAALGEDEWRFVLAHEMLHAALRHTERTGRRDPYLFNVACDYVINAWLIEMHVGAMPSGALYDAELAGLTAEEIYDRIATDLRRLRRLATLGGKGKPDLLPHSLPGRVGDGTDLDEFYRRALLTGLDYQTRSGRGLLPAGLVEEIKALEQPPPPWDVKLAHWFEEFVPSAQPIRSYARASRRQAASPGIPRPGRYLPTEPTARATFGVVLDTSVSMDRRLLGKALGAIASYAASRDVLAARVVYCDAAPYDAGFLSPDDLAGRVRLSGRGGTVLQPAITLLDNAKDFPSDAPVLIITDGWCDPLRIRRDHAYLVPQGARLPFQPRGPVFVFK